MNHKSVRDQKWVCGETSISRLVVRRFSFKLNPKKITAFVTAFIFALSMCINPAMAETINVQGGSIDVNVQENTTNWNVTGNPVWNVPEFNVAQNSIYNISGLGAGASLALLVNGGSASNIFGTMNISNLNFILQNIAGINIGSSAMINLSNASLIASTLPLNLNVTDFLKRDYQFGGEGGFLMNAGKIVGSNADLVAFVANAIENKGTIEVPMGTVALAAGKTVAIGISGDGLVSIGVDEATANTMGLSDQIKSTGTLKADGGRVVLNAKAIDGLFDKAVNIAAGSNATEAVVAKDGQIEFVAKGDVKVDASLGAERGEVKADVAGDLEFTGNITASHSTLTADKVKLTGNADQTLKGDMTISNFEVTVPSKTIYFEAGKTYTFKDSLHIEGAVGGDKVVYLKSTEKGTPWYIDVQSPTYTFSKVAVGDSYNVNGTAIYASPSSTLGNNQGWHLNTVYWVGGMDNLWSTVGNWSGGTPDGQDVRFDAAHSLNLTSIVDGNYSVTTFGISDWTGTITLTGGNLTVTGAGVCFTQTNGTFNETRDIPGTALYNVIPTLGTLSVSGSGVFNGPSNPNGATTAVTRVSSWTDLDSVRYNLSYKYYLTKSLLTTDGDYAGLGDTWVPIGNFEAEFSGSFDGGGFTIDGLTSVLYGDYTGLFKYTSSTATISNVGLTNVSLTGWGAGGVVGMNGGTISSSYSTGTVTGENHAGGLVGANTGTIIDSYSNCTVTGTGEFYNDAGGLVGSNPGTGVIINSYSTGSVSGWVVGGLVGDSRGSITNSYSIGAVSGSDTEGGLIGYKGGTVTNSGWLKGAGSPDYAIGWAEGVSGPSNVTYNVTVGGSGEFIDGSASWFYDQTRDIYTAGPTPWDFTNVWHARVNNPSNFIYEYTLISTWTGLAAMASSLSGSYLLRRNLLTTDSDYSGIGDAWTSVGASGTPFAGYFDGATYTIDGLTINASTTDNVGFFGYTDSSAVLANAHLTNVTVVGQDTVGGLVGNNSASISNSYVSGSITGSYIVGGLVGENHAAISNSYSTGTVDGVHHYVGGLVGYNSANIDSSYSTSTVGGSDYVGGLLGYDDAIVSNSYSTGNVSGNMEVGGLVGVSVGGYISNSYSTGTVIGSVYVGGLVGGSVGGGTVINSYSIGNVSGDDGVGGLVGWNNAPSTITASFSTGKVTGTGAATNIGGLVGGQSGTVTASSYWYYDPAGTPTHAYGDGTDTNAVKITDADGGKDYFFGSTHAPMSGWNLTTVWETFSNAMPHLQWENYTPSVSGITISGNVYASWGGSLITDPLDIMLAINGTQDLVSVATVGGAYTFSSKNVLAGQTVLVYISGNALDGNTVTLALDGTTAITGLNIYGSALVLTHAAAGPMTNDLLATAKGAIASDIVYSVASHNLTLNAATDLVIASGKIFTPGGSVTVPGSVYNVGTFNPEANAINVAGNWSNSGTFNEGTSTVTFNGANQTIYGDNTFNNLTKTPAGTDTLTFEHGKTQTITGTLTLQGLDTSHRLALRSDVTGQTWSINPSGTRTLSNLDVEDSRAITSSAINVVGAGSVSSGNNSRWLFVTPANYTWLGDGGSNLWNTASNWYGGIVPTSANTAYFDGAASLENAVINTDLTAANGRNIAGINIGATYTGALTQGAYSMEIGASGYSQANGTFTGGSANITDAGAFTITGGTFNSTTGNLSLSGSWSNAGTFNGGTGKVTFKKGGSQTITAGTGSFNNIDVTNNTAVTLGGDLHLTGNLDVASGSTFNTATNYLLIFDGSSSQQTIGGYFSNLRMTINNTHGVALSRDSTWNGGVNVYLHSQGAGSFDTAGYTLAGTISNATGLIDGNFVNLKLGLTGGNGSYLLVGDAHLTGNLDTGTTGFDTTASYYLVFDGSGSAQTIGGAFGNLRMNINNTHGVALSKDSTWNGGTNVRLHTTGAGSFDTAGYTLAGTISNATGLIDGNFVNLKLGLTSGNGSYLLVGDVHLTGNLDTGTTGFDTTNSYYLVFDGVSGQQTIGGVFGNLRMNINNASGVALSRDSTWNGGTNVYLHTTGAGFFDTAGYTLAGTISNANGLIDGNFVNLKLGLTGGNGSYALAADTHLTGDLDTGSTLLDTTTGYYLVFDGVSGQQTIGGSFQNLRMKINNVSGVALARDSSFGYTAVASVYLHSEGAGVFDTAAYGFSGYIANSYGYIDGNFGNLKLGLSGGNGSYILNGNLTLSGDLNFSSALNENNHNITLGGDWVNAASFTPGTGTVTLNGTNQTIYGNNTFKNLTKTVSGVDTLTFEAGKTQTVQGTLTLKGVSGGILSLASDAPGTQWKVNASAVNMEYLNISDSNNLGTTIDLTSKNCVNGGNNTGFTFPVVPVDPPAPPPPSATETQAVNSTLVEVVIVPVIVNVPVGAPAPTVTIVDQTGVGGSSSVPMTPVDTVVDQTGALSGAEPGSVTTSPTAGNTSTTQEVVQEQGGTQQPAVETKETKQEAAAAKKEAAKQETEAKKQEVAAKKEAAKQEAAAKKEAAKKEAEAKKQEAAAKKEAAKQEAAAKKEAAKKEAEAKKQEVAAKKEAAKQEAAAKREAAKKEAEAKKQEAAAKKEAAKQEAAAKREAAKKEAEVKRQEAAAKKEAVEQEPAKQEGSNQEAVKEEVVKQENAKQEETKGETIAGGNEENKTSVPEEAGKKETSVSRSEEKKTGEEASVKSADASKRADPTWRDVPMQSFFEASEKMKKLLTDVRVVEGAVYVIDGVNAMSLLEMGDSMRVLYRKQKDVTANHMQNAAAAKAQGLPEVWKKTEMGSDLAQMEATRVLKSPSPIVMRQTKDGVRYGTLKNPGDNVFVKCPGGQWQAAKDGMIILPGDEVKTAERNSVEVLMDGGKVGRVEVMEGSLFRINKAETDALTGDKTTLLDLALGKIIVKAEALKGRSKFEVRTPTALTGVRGTVFEVTVRENHKV